MKPGLVPKSGAAAGVVVTLAVETVVATLPGVTTDGPGVVITLDGTVDLSAGGGTTATVIRIRRGVDITGPVVGVAEVAPIAGGGRGSAAIQAIDAPGEVVSQSYVLTVQQTGGTANGTINSAVLTATY